MSIFTKQLILNFRKSIFFLVFVVSLSSCGVIGYQYQSSYWTAAQLKVTNNTCQTQGGVTICIEPLNNTNVEYKKSIYNNVPFDVMAYDLTGKISKSQFNYPSLEFFTGTLLLKVTIINGTDHIISLSDSRLAYIAQSSGENIFSMSKSDLSPDNIDANLPIQNIVYKKIKGRFPETPDDLINNQIHSTLLSIIKQTKVLFYSSTEILPSSNVSGYAVFPMDPLKITDGKFSFIDVIVKSDKAANTIEKVRMDFDSKNLISYWKSDPPSPANFIANKNSLGIPVKITKDEYSNGQTLPDKYYWDNKTNAWIKR